MALESHYWRLVLKREAAFLSKQLELRHDDIAGKEDKYFSIVELKMMTIAYIIRKLGQMGKLPDKVLAQKVHLKAYARTKIPSGRVAGIPDFTEEYDPEIKLDTAVSLQELCNQFIHSYILQAIGDDDKAFVAALVVSDHHKDRGLYEVTIRQIIELANAVANAHVTDIHRRYSKEDKKWLVERN